MKTPEYSPDLAEPWIVGCRPGGRCAARGHGAELVNREDDTTLADPRLAVEEGASVAE